MDLDSDSDIDPVNRPSSVFDEEGELSDPDQDFTSTDTDQALSEEQTYQETVCGIRSFMGWTHITLSIFQKHPVITFWKKSHTPVL